MAYLAIDNFRQGMDRRRPRTTGVPGTLWTLKNGFITRGGDIEGAKKFVSQYSLPAGTFGLGAVRGQLHVFGSGTAPGGLSVDVQYTQLAAPNTPTMVRVLDAKPFDGKMYVVAEYDDGNIYHFYNGSQVTDWSTVADSLTSFEAVAEALAAKITANAAVNAEAFGAVIRVKAATAGTAFTISATATDAGGSSVPSATHASVTANVAAVAEARATGSVTITGGTASPGVNRISQVTINGTNLLSAAVDWISSNDLTALALSNAINSYASTSGYTASVAGATVTITAAVGTGATPNGYVVAAITGGGNVTTTDVNMSGGVTAVTAVAQVDKVTIGASSTIEATDTWHVTVNGTEYKVTGRAAGTARSVLVFKGRIYAPCRGVIKYTVLNSATDWTTTTTPASDAGTILISKDSDGSQLVHALAKHNGRVAVFASEAIPIYNIFADAEKNSLQETLESFGGYSPRSPVSYGNTDVFYLDGTGIRSVKSREGYDANYVGDVGSAVDAFVQEVLGTLDEDTIERAVGVVEPIDGRYMLALGGYVLALSFFPESKITAWSYLDPGFTITDMVRARRRLYVRAGDTIYLYGGEDGDTWPGEDEQITTVESVFMSANDPAAMKNLTGFDAAVVGDWDFDILADPNDETKVIATGVLNSTSYNKGRIGVPGYTALLAFRATCASAGRRLLSNAAIHFEKERAS